MQHRVEFLLLLKSCCVFGAFPSIKTLTIVLWSENANLTFWTWNLKCTEQSNSVLRSIWWMLNEDEASSQIRFMIPTLNFRR